MSTVHTIATRTHGRYLIDAASPPAPRLMLVGFHGYGERAEAMLDVLRRVRGDAAWLLVSVQALHRFYTRSEQVVASWMTREDREVAIGDNIVYVEGVVRAVRAQYPTLDRVIYVGFSQGVAMAYRAMAFVADATALPAAAGGIVLAGDVPPDVVPRLAGLPPVLIGRGTSDDWYTEAKAAADVDLFARAGRTPAVHVFDGGHTWDDAFIVSARQFITTIDQAV